MLANKRQFFKILSVSLVILIALLVFSICFNLVKGVYLTSQKQALEKELALLEQTLQKNKAEIEFMQSKDYTDRFAREHLGLNHDNEEVYQGVEK